MSEVLTIRSGDREIHMHALPGKTAREWRKGRPYEYRLLRHIRECGFAGVAIDGGAGIGNHTLWLAGVCGLDVVAFEPVRHEDVARNLAINPDMPGTVRLERLAIGATAGTTRHASKGRMSGDSGDIEVRTIDSYELQDVALVKLDVEGMEAAALQGARETLRRWEPVVFAEEWSADEHSAIAAVLEPLGYTLTQRFSGAESRTPVGRWDP
jgi:FkbM family methyltransferase